MTYTAANPNRQHYAEYIEHDSIPGGRAYIGMPRGKTMTLSATDWHHSFRNRKACLAWLYKTMPDALIYATNEGTTVCGGTIRAMVEPDPLTSILAKYKPEGGP